MKARFSTYLVRICVRWMDASYGAYVRVDKGEMPKWWHDMWSKGARWVNKIILPIAQKIDKETAVTEMIESGWYF